MTEASWVQQWREKPLAEMKSTLSANDSQSSLALSRAHREIATGSANLHPGGLSTRKRPTCTVNMSKQMTRLDINDDGDRHNDEDPGPAHYWPKLTAHEASLKTRSAGVIVSSKKMGGGGHKRMTSIAAAHSSVVTGHGRDPATNTTNYLFFDMLRQY